MPAIEIDGLTKRFRQTVAVDEVRFDVPKGAVYGFLGPNGAGKTTTLGMLTGLIPPDGGTARIGGHDVRTDLAGAMQRTGALVEAPAFYTHLTGQRNLRLMARVAGVTADAADDALARMGLDRHADLRYGHYSQGMRRRLGLAAVLLGDPDVLILDEPTSGLDPAGQQEIRRLLGSLSQGGRTILLSSHILPEVQAVCSDVAVLHQGRVVAAGPLADVLQAQEVLHVDVDDVSRAVAVLRELPAVASVQVEATTVQVAAPVDAAADVNRALVEAGIAVRRLVPGEAVLEERFFELTQGGA